MTQPFDDLVVGAGFAGSVLAERLASQQGARVLVVETRSHITGNAHDRYDELAAWFAKAAEPKARVLTSEDAVISQVGRDLYDKFFRGYTRKQWGLDPSEVLSANGQRTAVPGAL